MEKLLISDMVSDEQKNFWILETTRGGGSRLGTVPITLGCVYTLCMALANGLLISNCQCFRTNRSKGHNLDLKIRLVTICDQMSSHPCSILTQITPNLIHSLNIFLVYIEVCEVARRSLDYYAFPEMPRRSLDKP